MRTRLSLLVFNIGLVGLGVGCALLKPTGSRDTGQREARADREFRGVWVATVDNIDWPSKPGLSTEDQKKEARAILDTAVSIGFNAIIFQVRPHCDAFYASELEPWSYYLSGTQGKAPDPFYDPLEFWVREAHERGLELHAWFNPFRAHLPKGGEVTDSSIVRKHPEMAKKLREGTYWLDPGKRETQDHSFQVVMDVVRRYDIDGVHFDDYFYPYGDGSFPDDDTWDQYTRSGGPLSREDWRRANVNVFIERVYEGIRKEKPFVKFGLSPFGIWRPSFPPSISGFDQYSTIYADARLWLNNGWVDYFSPQLYWPINQIQQSYPVLLGWWSRENLKGRNLWPGLFSSRMNSEKGLDEIINEIMVARGFEPETPGHIHFSMKTFLKDSSWLNSGLRTGPYQRQAIVPSSPWLDDHVPLAPTLQTAMTSDTLRISWSPNPKEPVFRWVVYYEYGKFPGYKIMNANDRTFALPLSMKISPPPWSQRTAAAPEEKVEFLSRVGVTCVSRTENESEQAKWGLGPVAAEQRR